MLVSKTVTQWEESRFQTSKEDVPFPGLLRAPWGLAKSPEERRAVAGLGGIPKRRLPRPRPTTAPGSSVFFLRLWGTWPAPVLLDVPETGAEGGRAPNPSFPLNRSP